MATLRKNQSVLMIGETAYIYRTYQGNVVENSLTDYDKVCAYTKKLQKKLKEEWPKEAITTTQGEEDE
jgi:hypothetical protein